MLKRILLVLWVAIFGLELSAVDPCLNAYSSADKEYQAFLKDKKKVKSRANWEKMAQKFEGIARTYPKCEKADDALLRSAKIWNQAAKNFKARPDRDKALTDIDALVRRFPKSSLADDAMLLAGQIYLDLGDKKSAASEFNKILSSYPKSDMAGQAKRYLASNGACEDDMAEKPEPPETPESKAFSSKTPAAEKTPFPTKAPLRRNDAIALILGNNGATVEVETAQASQLLNIRYWSAPSYTRIVLDLDRKTEFSAPRLLKADSALGTSDRIYFDLENTRLSPDFRSQNNYKDNCYELTIGDGLLRRARVGQYRPDVARVVIDLQSFRDFKSFAFPGEGGGWRVILDVYGEQTKLPPAATAVPPAQATTKPVVPPAQATTKPVIPPAQPTTKPVIPPAQPTTKPTAKSKSKLKPEPKPKAKPVEPEPTSKKPLIIVIDPGHGGKDPGAVGRKKTKEKDITLLVSQALAAEMRKQFPDAKIILTRKDDRYIPLVERTAKANALASENPDIQDAIFVSIHCNASPDRSTTGIETYYLDNTTDHAALRLAAAENFVSEEMLKEAGSYTNQILADLNTNSKVNLSIPLAESVQKNVFHEVSSKYPGAEDHGVKKAPFWVLTGATMPAVLVELSFLSNAQEEKRLSSPAYQKTLAKGIAMGIKNYQSKIDSGQVVVP
jgi:N-acetylmuramoyl-L-alanine amidase